MFLNCGLPVAAVPTAEKTCSCEELVAVVGTVLEVSGDTTSGLVPLLNVRPVLRSVLGADVRRAAPVSVGGDGSGFPVQGLFSCSAHSPL